MHSVAGLMFSFGLVDYLICHPEAFTPGVFTQCAVGLLTAIGGISAGKAYMQDKTAQPTVAPASDPDHTASPLPNESKPS
jgi:hypothetical protein